jgi:cytochrome c oxidase subunit 2
MWDFPLFPEQASTFAKDVDALYFALVAITAFFALLIYFLIAFFSVRYKRGSQVDRSNPPASNHKLEAAWIIIPLAIELVLFTWSTDIYFKMADVPKDAMEVTSVGKQWMWKFQSPGGQREINELHVPVGKRVKVTMISQDVIHSLYFPAFRVKQDVLPGRYTTLWFEATKVGTYHMFCAEYCGNQHSGMVGRVVVMSPGDYQRWLSGGNATETPAVAGEKLFMQTGCNTCHQASGAGRAPSLEGVFGTDVPLVDGGTAHVDEDYLRESITNPRAKQHAGYDAIMPTYAGQISEEGIMQLIAYIKSMAKNETIKGK